MTERASETADAEKRRVVRAVIRAPALLAPEPERRKPRVIGGK